MVLLIHTVLYNLTNPMCNKIFNFNTFVSTINADVFQGTKKTYYAKDQNL